MLEMQKDPVCGMDVDPTQSAGTSDHEGRTYYFCAPECKREFDAGPDRFIRDNELLDRERGGI